MFKTKDNAKFDRRDEVFLVIVALAIPFVTLSSMF